MLSNKYLYLSFALLLALVSCTQNKELEIPANCPLAIALGVRTFYAFDNVYPSKWPIWLKLPSNVFLAKTGSIIERGPKSETYGKAFIQYSAHTLQEVSKENVINYYKDLIHNSGLEFTENYSDPYDQLLVNIPDSTIPLTINVLSIDGTKTLVYCRVLVTIYK